MTEEAAAVERLPWERRDELGGTIALLGTIKLFVAAPREAFARTRPTASLSSPLLFGVVVGTLGVLLNILGALVFGSLVVFDLPPQLEGILGISIGGQSLEWIPLLLGLLAGSVLGTVVAIIAFPPIFVLGLVIWSGVLHGAVRIVGGLRSSEAGFRGTFTVAAYSSLAFVLHLVPVVGDLLATVWVILLHTIGLAVVHRTSYRRAFAGVVLPFVALAGALALGALLGSEGA